MSTSDLTIQKVVRRGKNNIRVLLSDGDTTLVPADAQFTLGDLLSTVLSPEDMDSLVVIPSSRETYVGECPNTEVPELLESSFDI